MIPGKTFEDYTDDALLRSGVERQLEIIGEALRVAVQHRPVLATQITDVPAIIAFRNQLTHAYSAIAPSHRLGRAGEAQLAIAGASRVAPVGQVSMPSDSSISAPAIPR